MIIKRLVIYGYGKWVDTTFDLSSDLHLFYGENEAGKSTLMSFIHSILFGFPTRHSALLRYEPKDSSRYGGKMIIEDHRFGEVSIERIQGKSTGDVTVLLEDGATGSEELLHTVLQGIDRNLYQSVFSFHLRGIEQVEEMTKEQLNRYFLSAGALGTEQFLQRADQLKQQANKLYKPTGRVPKINRAVKSLEKKKKALEAARNQNTQYLAWLEEAEQFKAHIAQTEQRIDSIQQTLEHLQTMEQQWELVKEIQSIEKEIKQLDTADLSENGLYALNHLNRSIEQNRSEIRNYQEKLKAFQQAYEPSKELMLYQENESSIETLAVQVEDINEMIREKQFIKKEADRLEQQLIRMKLQGGLDIDDELSKAITQAEKEKIQQNQTSVLRLETECQTLKENEQKLEYRISSTVDQIDQLEKGLWSNEAFKKAEDHHSKENRNKDSKQSATLEVSLISVLTIVLLGNVFLKLLFSGMIYLLGVLGIAAAGANLLRKRRLQKQESQEYDDYETFIEQKELRKQWRQYLFAIDQLEEEKRHNEKIIQEKQIQLQQLTEEWEKIQKDKNIPKSVQLSQALQYEENMMNLRKEEKELIKLQRSISELETAVFLKSEQFDVVSELFTANETPEQKFDRFKSFYTKVKQERNQLQQYVLDSQEVRRILNQSFESEKNLLNQKQTLLQKAGADSEEVFRHLYGILKQKNEKTERLTVLKEQLKVGIEQINSRSIEDIQQERKQLAAEKQQLSADIKEKTEQRIELEIHIKKLEEGGEYTTLLQEFENEKSSLQTLVNDWVAKQLASYMIERTLQYARKDRLPETIKDAERFFSYLTEGRYQKIVIQEDNVHVLDAEGRYFEATELSRGTAEPLYVSLRLAFIQNISDMIQMPLLIDDGFVNLDQKRRNKMYTLLKEISQTTQVIYFSFDLFSSEVLEEYSKTQLKK